MISKRHSTNIILLSLIFISKRLTKNLMNEHSLFFICFFIIILIFVFTSTNCNVYILLLVPAELGDYDPELHDPDYVSDFKFIPEQVQLVI